MSECLCSQLYRQRQGGWVFGNGAVVCQACLREYDRKRAEERALFVHRWDDRTGICRRCGVTEETHEAAMPPGRMCK